MILIVYTGVCCSKTIHQSVSICTSLVWQLDGHDRLWDYSYPRLLREHVFCCICVLKKENNLWLNYTGFVMGIIFNLLKACDLWINWSDESIKHGEISIPIHSNWFVVSSSKQLVVLVWWHLLASCDVRVCFNGQFYLGDGIWVNYFSGKFQYAPMSPSGVRESDCNCCHVDASVIIVTWMWVSLLSVYVSVIVVMTAPADHSICNIIKHFLCGTISCK